MKGKQPFMPLFFGDLLASTTEWRGEEISLYVTLLGHQWVLGSLPNDVAALARLVRWDRRSFSRCWTQVQHKFSTSPAHLLHISNGETGAIGSRLCNLRLEEHRARSAELSAKNAEAGKRGAAKRWGSDSERHADANGENMSGATEAPQPDATTEQMANATKAYSNPSHPIKEKKSPLRGPKENGASRRPAKRCPPDFVVTDDQRRWAERDYPAIDVDRETAAFRDHEYRTAKTDWPAAWRSWIRKAASLAGSQAAAPQQRRFMP